MPSTWPTCWFCCVAPAAEPPDPPNIEPDRADNPPDAPTVRLPKVPVLVRPWLLRFDDWNWAMASLPPSATRQPQTAHSTRRIRRWSMMLLVA